jgi:hypothetical protein
MTATPPSTGTARRYIFSGHAVGAWAQFNQLDYNQVNRVVPTQGATVLPPAGGLSTAHARNFSFDVDQPRPRTLLSVRQIESTASGRTIGGNGSNGAKFETEVESEIHGVKMIDKLHIERVKLHMLSTLDTSVADYPCPVVSTKGNLIDGLWLGRVEVKVELDNEVLCACGTQDQLGRFYQDKGDEYRQQNAGRFFIGGVAPGDEPCRVPYSSCSLVRKIELCGSEIDKQSITIQPDGYTICWEGFGRIILGEVIVKGNERQLTLVRLAMGSPDVGPGGVGDGKTNGALGG